MTKGVVQAHHAGARRALAVIADRPGIQREELAFAIGCGVSHTAEILRTLSAAGMAGNVPLDSVKQGRARGWYTSERLPDAKATWDELARKREQGRVARGLKNMQQKAKARTVEYEEVGADYVHRLLPANTSRPLPFKCRAPNSVFQLGEAK